jgi:hypothetical protein
MKNTLVILLFPLLWNGTYANGDDTSIKIESLIRIDTVQISPDIPKMIFKYFGSSVENGDHDASKKGRFEVSYLGDMQPFQIDSVENVLQVEYEDANFDNVLDIKIFTYWGLGLFDDHTEYHTFNIDRKRFELYLHGAKLTIDDADSTISDSWYYGRRSRNAGYDKKYKCVKGRPVLVFESEGNDDQSYKKNLIGDSLVTTARSVRTYIDDINCVDSSWAYCYNKLRLDFVRKKKLLVAPPTQEQLKIGEAEEDVTGKFLWMSEEFFKYKRNKEGLIICTYHCNKVQDGKWKLVNGREWPVKK